MSKIQIRRATTRNRRLRLALCGGPGSGKTFTALRLGMALAKHAQCRLLVLDSEHGSSELYQDVDNPDGGTFDFDVINLEELPGKFSPRNYIDSLRAGFDGGYRVVVIDSLSHAWAGEGGTLEQVDNIGKRQGKGGDGNKFAAWRDGTRMQNDFVDEMLSFPGALIATLRTKVEYVLEAGKNGKMAPVRKGMASIQREGMEYEFTAVAEVDAEHRLYFTKTRIADLADRAFDFAGGRDLGKELIAWASGSEQDAPPPRRREPEEDPAPEREFNDDGSENLGRAGYGPDPRDGGDSPDDGPPWTDSQDVGSVDRERERAAAAEYDRRVSDPERKRDPEPEPAKPEHQAELPAGLLEERRKALAGAGLDPDHCSWYAMAHTSSGEPLGEMTAATWARAKAFFVGDVGREKVADAVKEAKAEFQRLFFAKWSLLYPPPRKGDGLALEGLKAANEVNEGKRRTLWKDWYGAGRFEDLTLRAILRSEHGVTWLRRVSNVDFEREVVEAIRRLLVEDSWGPDRDPGDDSEREPGEEG